MLGEVIQISESPKDMPYYLGRAVARHGRELFKEDWRLEGSRNKGFCIVRYTAKGSTVLTDPLELSEFALWWDGFRFCATQMSM